MTARHGAVVKSTDAVVDDADLDRVRGAVDHDLHRGGPGVLQRVRQRFLHDAVHRELNCRGQARNVTVDSECNWQAGSADIRGQLSELGEPRLRHRVGRMVLFAKHSEQAAHFDECFAAAAFDLLERRAVGA
jgi:hypothetical protein